MLPTAITFLGFTWLGAALLMLALWLWHRRISNAAVVDVGWAFGLAAAALLDAAFAPGVPARRWVAGLTMGIWGARLGLHLLRDRVIGHREDARYAELRRARAAGANRWFFWFFQAQALLVVLLSWPALALALDPTPRVSPLVWIGAGLWALSIAGEAVADAQLREFKKDGTHRNRTCRAGLWRYSRHPNYFFEWLVWVAYALAATASPGGWAAWFCPALMLYLLFRVTGIPATEAQALRSRGDDYREYQRTTSAFVPWVPRS